MNNQPLKVYLDTHNGAFISIDRSDQKCFAYAKIAAKINFECRYDSKRLAKFRRTLKKEQFNWLDKEYKKF
jgi:hypothetical protein